MKKLKDNWQMIPIDKLVKAEWNYKEEDEERSEALANNIKRNSQIVNLIVRPLRNKFEVIDGNHRLEALEIAGCEDAVCFNVGKISKAHAMRISVEINETRFESNQVKLAQTMSEILKEFSVEDFSSTTIFSEDEVKAFQDLLDFDFEKFEEEQGEQSEEGWTSVSELFKRHGITDIPDDLAMKIGEMIEQIADENELSPKNKFQVFDDILANYLHNRG